MAPNQRNTNESKQQLATKSTTTTTTNTTQKQQQIKSSRMPLWIVLLSGLTNFSLIVWAIIWIAMIILIDPQRVQIALEQQLSLFIFVSFGFCIALGFSQYQIMMNSYYMEARDQRLMGMARILGVMIILAIFRFVYFDTLTAKDIRDILPEGLPTDINAGI